MPKPRRGLKYPQPEVNVSEGNFACAKENEEERVNWSYYLNGIEG